MMWWLGMKTSRIALIPNPRPGSLPLLLSLLHAHLHQEAPNDRTISHWNHMPMPQPTIPVWCLQTLTNHRIIPQQVSLLSTTRQCGTEDEGWFLSQTLFSTPFSSFPPPHVKTGGVREPEPQVSRYLTSEILPGFPSSYFFYLGRGKYFFMCILICLTSFLKKLLFPNELPCTSSEDELIICVCVEGGVISGLSPKSLI